MSVDIEHANGHTHTDDAPRVLVGKVVADTLTIPAQTPPEGLTSDARRARLARTLRRTRHGGIRALRLARAGYGRGRAFVRHETTRAVVLRLVREGAYVLAGFKVIVGWRRDRRTAAPMRRMMKAAAAIGDHDKALEWEARAAAHDQARHDRFMARLMLPVHLARGAAYIAGGMLALGIGLAFHTHRPGEVMAPFNTVAEVVMAIAGFVSATWRPALVASPFIAVAVASWAGHTKGEIPARFAPAGQAPDTVAITPSIVVTALRDLGISALRKAITDMADAGAAMLGPIRIAGCGVEVDVTLPSGVSTDEIQSRRRKLAENLGRHRHEVFITIPEAARTVRLWVADSGALDEPIGPSPLVVDATMGAEWRTGRAPWGVDLRGDQVALSAFQRHMLVTGLSNQGKTAALRALALWLAQDPTVEFRLADLKGVGDWAMFDRLATVLIQGPTDEHVIAATEMLESLVEEMERRIVAVQGSGSTEGITREMERTPGSGFHPLIGLVDEAQVAFMCPAKGEDGRPYGGSRATSRYFMAARRIHNQGRAVNVLLWQGTQDPTDQNLPKLVREGAHIRASLALGTESQSRMALGDKAVDGGAAPHELRQGLDKGTLVVAGDGVKLAPGQSSVTVRTHFVSGDDAATIADRAKTRRKPVTTNQGQAEDDVRDLLADLADVLGAEPVPAADVPALLRELAPKHKPYAGLSGKALREQLATLGVKVASTGNRYPVDPAEVRKALALRPVEDEA
jgi:S-DNA-T family DNA segregation ATPase FtsK/SpoIIIE